MIKTLQYRFPNKKKNLNSKKKKSFKSSKTQALNLSVRKATKPAHIFPVLFLLSNLNFQPHDNSQFVQSCYLSGTRVFTHPF